MPYFVYILQSESSGRYYIGHTDNIARRISQHNDPACWLTEFTKLHRGPWKCVYTEEYDTRSEAVRREKQIKLKKTREYIEYLIVSKDSPECFRDSQGGC